MVIRHAQFFVKFLGCWKRKRW